MASGGDKAYIKSACWLSLFASLTFSKFFCGASLFCGQRFARSALRARYLRELELRFRAPAARGGNLGAEGLVCLLQLFRAGCETGGLFLASGQVLKAGMTAKGVRGKGSENNVKKHSEVLP